MAVYAAYCFHQFGMLPSEFNKLGKRDLAFIMSAIDIKVERERKEQEKMKRRKR